MFTNSRWYPISLNDDFSRSIRHHKMSRKAVLLPVYTAGFDQSAQPELAPGRHSLFRYFTGALEIQQVFLQ